MKTGIILLNFGGPTTVRDVKPFLYNLFSDPSILVGMPTPIRKAIALFISRVKGPGSEKMYAQIGGGSPILKWTQSQGDQLEGLLDETYKVAVGMRASAPFIYDALKELKEWGADRLVLLPLFPQFSTTTTGSCFTDVKESLKKLSWRPEIVEVTRWPDQKSYIELMQKTVIEAVEKAKASSEHPVYVLFSAHSLPMKIIKKGDPYPNDVDATVKAIASCLDCEWSLAFQSRNGPIPWLKPYTEDEIERLGKKGIKNMVVVPVSFVSDHIETLFEIDIMYAELAKANGIESFSRSRSFNDDPEFSAVLKNLVQTQTVPSSLMH